MKKFYAIMIALLLGSLSYAQSTINITTTGGSFTSEKWVNITTEVDGGGTQVWGQGDETYGNGSGLINQDINLAPGTYYVNCYDSFSDGWDGTTISVTAYGSVIGDNGGVSPNNFSDDDSNGSFETPADELEASFEIIVPAPPSCQAITSLAIDSFGSDSVQVSWNASPSAETAWEVAVQTDGTGEPGAGDGSGTDTSSNPYSESGLSPETDYEVYVRAECTAGSDFGPWVGPVTFTTACAVFTPDYNEDFETFLDSCWTEGENGDLTAGPASTGSGAFTADDFANNGANGGAAKINTFGSGDIDWLISPSFDLSADGYELVIDASILDWNSSTTFADGFNPGDVVSLVWSNDGTNWATLRDFVASPPAVPTETITIDLTGITGTTVQFAIYVEEDSSDPTGRDIDIMIGDFTVRTPPLCAAPSGLSLSNVTNSSVDASWTGGAGNTAYNLFVVPTGDPVPDPSSDAPDGVTTDPTTSVTLTTTGGAGPLSASTTYDVYLVGLCGVDISAIQGPETFTTQADPVTTFPYSEDFESGAGGWIADNTTNGTWELGAPTNTIINSAASGSNAWVTDLDGSYNANEDSFVVSPPFDFTGLADPTIELNIWYESEFSWDGMVLQSSIDGGSTWQNVGANGDPNNWFNDTSIDGNPGGQQEGWTGRNGGGSNGWLLASNTLTGLGGQSSVLIRLAFGSDGGVQDEGVAFDDVNIFVPSTETVDFCNLQFPGSGVIDEGDPFTPFARIFEGGVTEAAGPNALVDAWIGVSATDATTTADFETGAWTWIPATWNTQVGNDDEYSVDIGSGLAPGDYFYVSRFSIDNGPFAYGGNDVTDGDGGNFWNGTNFVSGQLTVNVVPPTTVATFDISGCGDSDTYSGAFDASVEGVVWIELIYDGGCSEITVDNETTTGFTDSEIALYDSDGNFIATDDDGGTGNLASLTQLGLGAGTYYIATGAFNMTFNATNFDVTTTNTTATGTIVVNASTPNTPDFVNLQFPGESTITTGGTQTVFAQIFEGGVTPGAGAGAGITAEIGISAVDATTVADFETVDWTWTPAPYFGEVGNNDEYSLDIGASLPVGTYYYVSRFSVDGGPFAYGGNTAGPGEGGNFWDGTSFVSGVLTVNPAGEPTNHVDSFAAAADSDTQITLTWNDNDGAQAANGFLIVGRTGATPLFTPTDGTDPADDTDWSDGDFEVQVLPGVETYTVTGLTASTLYDFEIYPFTNAGALIDFKTDGTVPSASATTDGDPCLVAIDTFPFTEGFESGVPPQCWTSFRGTNGLGTGFDWTTSGTANSGSSAAFVRYENVTGGNAQDWLVTPLLDFSGLTAPELTFFARESFGSDFGSVHSIQVSTTTNDIAEFSSVQGYTEADFSNTTYEEFIVDLSAFAGEATVYVAFVMENDDGDSWFIDDVTIDDNPPVTYTFNGTWTPNTPEGNATAQDDIVIASGDATIGSSFTCNSVTVNPGAGLTITTGNTVTVNNGMTLESNSTSYSSLILDGSVSGSMSYERHVNINGSGDTGSNDLISAPLTGEQFSTVATNNPNILNNGTLYLFGPFDKTTGDFVLWAGTETATLDPGVGYRAATSDNSTVTFSGTANNTTITNDIQNSGPQEEEWNLIGNPYPSYMNVQAFLNEDVGGGETNLTLFNPGTAAIWGYDGDALNGWIIYNLATTTPTTVMAPGQGFFVSADATKTAGFDVEFTPAMRSTGSSDDFIPGRFAELQYLVLNLNSATKGYNTDFYFNPAASEGFDLGYDAEMYESTAPDFSIYSHLVQDNNGKAMALQTMNASSLSDVTVPLGVHANQGEQIRFSIGDTTLPNSVSVYLDDVVANTSTLLNNGDYVITPTSDLSGTGRFFLRYSEDALSTVDASLDNLNIFALNSSQELVVSGRILENTTLELFDIQGRKVLTTELDSDLIENRLDVSSLNTGVYVVTVTNDNQNVTKKVILK